MVADITSCKRICYVMGEHGVLEYRIMPPCSRREGRPRAQTNASGGRRFIARVAVNTLRRPRRELRAHSRSDHFITHPAQT